MSFFPYKGLPPDCVVTKSPGDTYRFFRSRLMSIVLSPASPATVALWGGYPPRQKRSPLGGRTLRPKCSFEPELCQNNCSLLLVCSSDLASPARSSGSFKIHTRSKSREARSPFLKRFVPIRIFRFNRPPQRNFVGTSFLPPPPSVVDPRWFADQDHPGSMLH